MGKNSKSTQSKGSGGQPRAAASTSATAFHVDEPPAEIQAMMRSLGISSPDEFAEKVGSMSEQERMSLLTKAMFSGELSILETTAKKVRADPNTPLALIRGKSFSNFMCNGCAKQDVKFRSCKACHAVRYCSVECQKLDWTGRGTGPTRPRKHRDLCPELVQANEEFEASPNGIALRKKFTWADQHNDEGSFFLTEFLIRRDLLPSNGTFWDQADSPLTYHSGKDPRGYQHGQMLLKKEFPSLKKGWAKLRDDEFPADGPTSSPPSNNGLKSWDDYMAFRELSYSSVAPLLLTNVLTIYHMLYHELKLRKGHISVSVVGVEVELNQIPLFGELAYLMPGCDVELTMVSPAAKAICQEARNHGDSLLGSSNDGCVLDVQAPDMSGGGRVRVRLDANNEFFHDGPNYPTPDAVVGLNAGFDAYPTWNNTMHKLLRLQIPFSATDHTKLQHRYLQLVWFPPLLKYLDETYPEFPALRMPKLEIALNPFHSIVNRDIAAVQVPNMDNGYFVSWDGKSFE